MLGAAAGEPNRDRWQYQIRIMLEGDSAEAVRSGVSSTSLAVLLDVLRRHDAELHCQLDAFVGYCAEAERHGIEHYPLYAWTRATIEQPAKRARYRRSFAVHVAGNEIYRKDLAMPLERELRPLVETGVVESLVVHDTNPVNNPQPPRKFRR